MSGFSEELDLLVYWKAGAFVVENESDAFDHFVVVLFHKLLSTEVALGV